MSIRLVLAVVVSVMMTLTSGCCRRGVVREYVETDMGRVPVVAFETLSGEELDRFLDVLPSMVEAAGQAGVEIDGVVEGLEGVEDIILLVDSLASAAWADGPLKEAGMSRDSFRAAGLKTAVAAAVVLEEAFGEMFALLFGERDGSEPGDEEPRSLSQLIPRENVELLLSREDALERLGETLR